jgi:hypothetical protein
MQTDSMPEPTPYEKFLRESLEEHKKQLEGLKQRYEKSNRLTRIVLKKKIEEITKNIELMSEDLNKYVQGLSWLREPSKKRDEKAEHLKPVSMEVFTTQSPQPRSASVSLASQPSATGPSQAPTGRPTIGRPIIGKPIGGAQPPSSPRPTSSSPSVEQSPPATRSATEKPESSNAGAPQGSTSMLGSSSEAPVTGPNTVSSSSPQAQNSRPVIGKPIGTTVARPVIGKPITSSAGVSQPVRPRIGTPLTAQEPQGQPTEGKDAEQGGENRGKPANTEDQEKKRDETSSDQSKSGETETQSQTSS